MKKTNNTSVLLFLLGGLVIGFFIGRSTTEADEKTQYVKGETIRDTIHVDKLIPYRVEVPANPLLPTKNTENNKPIVDTAAIIQDYISKKDFSITAFDTKELGKLELFPSVQYNSLVGFDYSFTPIQKHIYKQRTWQPFVSGSYSTFNYIGLGAGVFYHNLGLEYQYQVGFKDKGRGHSFGLKYKF